MGKMHAAVLVFFAGGALGQTCAPEWGPAPAPDGRNGAVHAMLSFDDGSGPALYAAGSFTMVDGVPAQRIARWDGDAWEQVGAGLGEEVFALGAFDAGAGPRLFAAGMYYLVGDSTLAEWDGAEWRAVPDTPNCWIGALGVSDIGGRPELYISGPVFDYVRRWDGSAWRSAGGGLFGVFEDMAEFDDGSGRAVFVGGGIAAVYRFDGADWSPVGGDFSFDGVIHAMETFDDGSGQALFVGGDFRRVPGWETALRIVRWDGSDWAQVGDGFDGPVNALTVFDDGSGPALYAAGAFAHSGDAPLAGIARWDGAAWSPLGSGLDGPATASAVFAPAGSRPALVGAGGFTRAGGGASPGFAAWLGCGCRADFDADGAVDTRDVLAFLNAWTAGDGAADFNGDGVLDTRDVLAFLNAWSAGC
ncbi:MAG TPA: GC-type dockerin domain-anchored protein [Phycisphaerales bacterium]|nr:GC-type dockerin domain-anchored protein [Phycisphaerales bacterium]